MNLLVVDASALVEFLLRTERAPPIEDVLTGYDTDLHVPAICDVEVASALRRSLMAQRMTQERAVEALEDHLSLPLTRHGHQALLARVLDLRDALTAYDAVYVALAEALGAALLTADHGLARAARGTTELVVLPEGRAP